MENVKNVTRLKRHLNKLEIISDKYLGKVMAELQRSLNRFVIARR